MNNAISIKNLSKSFNNKLVVKNISFDVKKGEIFAFLGPNGSGKTTTIRCLLNIYEPDSGELLFLDQKYSPELSSSLGYLPEERGLYLNMKALELIAFFGEMKGIEKNESKKRAEQYLEKVGLSDKKDVQVKKLSSGQQQKIQLGITIIHNPSVLILDEPTKGLDPVNRKLLLDILLDLNKEYGTTIMFSTHILEDVERIADSVFIIKNGEEGISGTVASVKQKFAANSITLEADNNIPENKDLYSFEKNKNQYLITINKDKTKEDVLNYLIEQKISIEKFDYGRPSLEEVFIKVAMQET